LSNGYGNEKTWYQIKDESKGLPLVTYTPLATWRIRRTNSPKLASWLSLIT